MKEKEVNVKIDGQKASKRPKSFKPKASSRLPFKEHPLRKPIIKYIYGRTKKHFVFVI